MEPESTIHLIWTSRVDWALLGASVGVGSFIGVMASCLCLPQSHYLVTQQQKQQDC